MVAIDKVLFDTVILSINLMQAILAVFVDPAAEKVTPPTFWAMLAVVTVAAVCPFFEHDRRHRHMTLHHLHLDKKSSKKGLKFHQTSAGPKPFSEIFFICRVWPLDMENVTRRPS